MIFIYIYISIFCNGEMSICQYSTPRVFRKTPGARDGCETLWGHRVKLKLFFGFSRSCTLSIYKRCISYTYIIFVYLIYIYIQLYIIYFLIDNTQSTILYGIYSIFKQADVSYTGCFMLVNIDSYRYIYIYICTHHTSISHRIHVWYIYLHLP